MKKLKIEEPEDNKKKSKKDKKKKQEEVEEIEVEPELASEREKTPELTLAEQNGEYVHQMLINLATDEDKCDRTLIQSGLGKIYIIDDIYHFLSLSQNISIINLSLSYH